MRTEPPEDAREARVEREPKSRSAGVMRLSFSAAVMDGRLARSSLELSVLIAARQGAYLVNYYPEVAEVSTVETTDNKQ